jgi:hypothetical protein
VLIVVLSVIQQSVLLLLFYTYHTHFFGLGIDKDVPMWSHLRGVAAAQQHGCHSTHDSEDDPNPETTIRRRRSTERSIDSTNPCHRCRQRTAEARAANAPDSRPVALIHVLSANTELRSMNAPTAVLERFAGIDRHKRLSTTRLLAISPFVARWPPTLSLAET